MRETPATIAASFPWLEQAQGLVSEAELQGLARDLAPAGRDLARFNDRALDLLPQTDLAARCARDVLLPTGDVVIRDEFQTGRENYKDFFYALVGLAGEGQNFDGNGMYVRFQTGGGVAAACSSARAAPAARRSSAACRRRRSATGPPSRAASPPTIDDEPCHTQTLPDLNGPAGARTPPLGPGARRDGPAAHAARGGRAR